MIHIVRIVTHKGTQYEMWVDTLERIDALKAAKYRRSSGSRELGAVPETPTDIAGRIYATDSPKQQATLVPYTLTVAPSDILTVEVIGPVRDAW